MDSLPGFFDSSGLVPHGICLSWKPGLLYLLVVSDLLIAAAYFSIPITLFNFVAKRKDLKFRSVFYLFGAFILACGVTHVLEVWTIWRPAYGVEAAVKLLTALISIATAMMLWTMIPKALRLPSPAQLEASNLRLKEEIQERRAAKEQVLRLNASLELQVEQRTKELVALNEKLLEEIREREQAEADLRKLYRALEQSPNLVIITDAEGRIEYANSKALEVTGYSEDELIGNTHRLLSSGKTPQETYQELWQCIKSGHEWRGLLYNRAKDGKHFYWAQESIAPVKDDSGNITHFVAIQEDVTESKSVTERISWQASHDSLTGLINRYEFERRLVRLIAEAEADHTQHVLCFLDLDQFKIVNDSASHEAGDELLRQVSVIMKKNLRQSDTLARLGGDEFALLLEHCPTDQAERITELIRKHIEDFQFLWEGRSFRIGCSIGLVPIAENITSAGELLKQADAACYAAKDKGRNRIHVFRPDDELLARRHGEMLWVNEINLGLDENRFRLFRQAIVPTQVIPAEGHHYELLIRLEIPNGELVPPGAFLPAAERYDVSGKIDRWVIMTYLDWLASHPSHLQSLSLASINLSGHSVGDPEMLNFILRRFEQTGIPARKTCFEITETAAITNIAAAEFFMRKLKACGCQFSLDDFGSGVSSFGYLRHLPVDYLKIDGIFVRDILDDAIDFSIVKSINEIGHVLGKKTVAEFVENAAILEKLRPLGVDFVQGYGVGMPEPLKAEQG